MAIENNLKLCGRLTADPELKKIKIKDSEGKEVERSVCNGSIAVNSAYSKEAEFYDFELWGAKADAFARDCKKGNQVSIEGQLKISNYEYEGQKRQNVICAVDEFRNFDHFKNFNNAKEVEAEPTVDEPEMN